MREAQPPQAISHHHRSDQVGRMFACPKRQAPFSTAMTHRQRPLHPSAGRPPPTETPVPGTDRSPTAVALLSVGVSPVLAMKAAAAPLRSDWDQTVDLGLSVIARNPDVRLARSRWRRSIEGDPEIQVGSTHHGFHGRSGLISLGIILTSRRRERIFPILKPSDASSRRLPTAIQDDVKLP